MDWGVTKKTACVFGLSIVLLFALSSLLKSETPTKGNVLGFIYGSDGATPIEGAILKVVNISTGSVYESTISNNNGELTISEVETGIYEYVEEDSLKGSPSFHLDFGSGLIYFYLENIEELETFISDLEDLKNDMKKPSEKGFNSSN